MINYWSRDGDDSRVGNGVRINRAALGSNEVRRWNNKESRSEQGGKKPQTDGWHRQSNLRQSDLRRVFANEKSAGEPLCLKEWQKLSVEMEKGKGGKGAKGKEVKG